MLYVYFKTFYLLYSRCHVLLLSCILYVVLTRVCVRTLAKWIVTGIECFRSFPLSSMYTTCQLWNTRPSSIFPLRYDLFSFKRSVSRNLDMIMNQSLGRIQLGFLLFGYRRPHSSMNLKVLVYFVSLMTQFEGVGGLHIYPQHTVPYHLNFSSSHVHFSCQHELHTYTHRHKHI